MENLLKKIAISKKQPKIISINKTPEKKMTIVKHKVRIKTIKNLNYSKVTSLNKLKRKKGKIRKRLGARLNKNKYKVHNHKKIKEISLNSLEKDTNIASPNIIRNNLRNISNLKTCQNINPIDSQTSKKLKQKFSIQEKHKLINFFKKRIFMLKKKNKKSN